MKKEELKRLSEELHKLTKKELAEVLYNAYQCGGVDSNGLSCVMVSLTRLDFSEFNCIVDISHMRVNKDLYQDSQEVKGKLYQNKCRVEDDIYQNQNYSGRDIIQGRQVSFGNIYQEEQFVKNCIFQGNSIAKEIRE